MKNSLSKILVGSLMAGALAFFPANESVKRAYAGEEITSGEYYLDTKSERIRRGGQDLEKFTMEKEKRFLIVERHLLKKGANIREYFAKRGPSGKSTIFFNGNEIRIVSIYDGINYSRPPRIVSEQEKKIVLGDFAGYLMEIKQQGYKALTTVHSNLQGVKGINQMEIEEVIAEIYQSEGIKK